MATPGPRDLFGFEDLPTSAIPDDVQAADDRTLRLAAPSFTVDEVVRFLRYQAALRDQLKAAPLRADQWNDHVSHAHEAALALSGLTGSRHAQLNAVASQFATRRSSLRRLKQRQEELRLARAGLKARGKDVPSDQQELEQRLASEVARLEPLAPLERRFGKQSVAALCAHEEELLELFSDVSRLLAR